MEKTDFMTSCLPGLHCEVLLTFTIGFDQTSLHFLELDISPHFPSKQGSNAKLMGGLNVTASFGFVMGSYPIVLSSRT